MTSMTKIKVGSISGTVSKKKEREDQKREGTQASMSGTRSG